MEPEPTSEAVSAPAAEEEAAPEEQQISPVSPEEQVVFTDQEAAREAAEAPPLLAEPVQQVKTASSSSPTRQPLIFPHSRFWELDNRPVDYTIAVITGILARFLKTRQPWPNSPPKAAST